MESDIGDFSKSYAKEKKVFDDNKISEEEALLKRQYIQACKLNDGQVLTYAEMAKFIGIQADSVEEWVIDASLNGILDAKIDQMEDKITIKSTMLR